jgi:hypothetical protein
MFRLFISLNSADSLDQLRIAFVLHFAAFERVSCEFITSLNRCSTLTFEHVFSLLVLDIHTLLHSAVSVYELLDILLATWLNHILFVFKARIRILLQWLIFWLDYFLG